jgi:hypothetical protein
MDSANQLQHVSCVGFAIPALDHLLNETLQAYETFLTSSPRFQKYFSLSRAQDFYTNVRNGLLHDGESRRGWVVKASPQLDLVAPRPDGYVIVNTERFHSALRKDFKAHVYAISELPRKDLRNNLVSAPNDLCARSRPKPLLRVASPDRRKPAPTLRASHSPGQAPTQPLSLV